ncbi:MAG: hypothetical protein H7335_09880 [Massilia sp.]|nr:hypothetical protein [Massilia sp.]
MASRWHRPRDEAALALQAMALEPAQAPLIRKALASERDGEIEDILRMLVATLDPQSPDAAVRKAGAVGMAFERSVIRWLYGRPLETLLATWGISLLSSNFLCGK